MSFSSSDSLLSNNYNREGNNKKEIFSKNGIEWMGLGFAIIWMSMHILMPMYNHELFRHLDKPLTLSWIQMIVSAIVLLSLACYPYFTHFLRTNHNMVDEEDWKRSRSMIFDRESFKTKCYYLFPAAIGFCFSIGLVNMSLSHKYEVNMVLFFVLRSSEIVWVILLARIIEKEIPSLNIYISIGFLIVGTFFTSMKSNDADNDSTSIVGVILALVSNVASAITTVAMRWGTQRLHEIDSQITVLEMSAIKISIATLFMTVFPFIFEGLSGWKAISHADSSLVLWLLCGIAMTLLLQTAIVGFANYAMAVTSGISGYIKGIPQIMISAIFFDYDFSWQHVIGIVLVIIGSAVFTIEKYMANIAAKQKQRQLNMNLGNFGNSI